MLSDYSDLHNMANAYTVNTTAAMLGLVNSTTAPFFEVEDDIGGSPLFVMRVFMMIMIAVGVLGNGCVIFIVLWNPSMRNRPNALVASLAIGDLLLLIICVPLKVYHMTYGQWPFGLLVCKLSNGFVIISQAVSIFSMVALSHDRYRAIVTPMNYPRNRGSGYTIAVISVIWVVAILLACPTIVLSHIRGSDLFSFCLYIHHTTLAGRLHACLRGLILFVIPLLVINGYYCLVSRKLIISTKALPGEVHDKRSQISARKRLAYVVLAIVILFTVCWLPFTVIEVMYQINDQIFAESVGLTYLKLFSDFLTYVNSSANPILIIVISSTYREYFCSYIFCRCSGDLQYKRARTSTISSKASSTRTRMTEFA
ncbi:neuromedin-B receptor-like [Asterias rubens]|uniref:neuromedin-B receptor-like n=1 Tax=Asterias rubens TaxID=7604 RepID=UPI001455326A|nr:neuromedin-B receptor-like [Asterias rubens]